MMQTVQIFTITCTTMQHYGEILHPLSWAFECGPTSLHISMEYTQKLTWKENNSGRGKKKKKKTQLDAMGRCFPTLLHLSTSVSVPTGS